MRLLLDTQVVLWWLAGSDELSETAANVIAEQDNDALVSVATVWEISIKQSIGKLTVDGDLRQHLRDQNFQELPVVGDHATAVKDLPFHHKDPFDRLLVAQAQCEGLTLVTSDRDIAKYKVPIVPAK